MRRIKNRLRANYYSIFYSIGKECVFQNIRFHKPSSGKMGKKSIQIGNHVTIFRYTELVAYNDKPIVIGDGSFVNQRCTISPNTYIGDNVCIGHSVLLITDSHKIGSFEKRAGEAYYPPIHIENGCWIGAHSTVLGGVTIGKGCIIAAGSVVNKDCDPNSLYAGVPARLIRKLDN